MTVVVGVDYLDEILVIGDSRVSYPNGQYEANRGLKKLLVFGNKNKVAALGFAGHINGARVVIGNLMRKLTPNYKRPLVIAHLKEDMRKWIQEVVIELPSAELEGLSFILCALEPSRRRPLRRGEVIVPSPFPERHICIYSVNSRKQVEMRDGGPIAVIGSGRELESNIQHQVSHLINFGRGAPNFQMNRLTVAHDVISLMFHDLNSSSVGGPFQIIRIVPPPSKSQEIYMWFPEAPEVEVEHKRDMSIMRNRRTGETCTLFPIWEWH